MLDAYYPSCVGTLRIGYEGECVKSIQKVTGEVDVPNHRTPFTDAVYTQLKAYLEGRRKEFDFCYELEGTPFQKQVWEALCRIPYGETVSYKAIAVAIGNPKASRAVGMANNRNPMTIVVPCHRVIGARGTMVGYAGGLEMKTFLIEMEARHK